MEILTTPTTRRVRRLPNTYNTHDPRVLYTRSIIKLLRSSLSIPLRTHPIKLLVTHQAHNTRRICLITLTRAHIALPAPPADTHPQTRPT